MALIMKWSELHKTLNLVPYCWNYMANSRLRAIAGNPVFVVGCGHSGTTLLLRIIGSHPHVHAILDESAVFAKKRWFELREFDMATLRHGKKRWVEKTPIHIRHIEKIFKKRPQARVIIIIRDGRDVADSIRARKGSLEKGIKRWVVDNSAGEKWSSDSRVLKIRYEDLIQKFEDTVKDVLCFIGEDYSDDVLKYHQKLHHPLGDVRPETVADQDHLKYRMWQVSQPLFDGRRRWVANYSEEDKRLFKAMAGEMLIRYGYEKSNDW
jgi:hypothetical protein